MKKDFSVAAYKHMELTLEQQEVTRDLEGQICDKVKPFARLLTRWLSKVIDLNNLL